MYVVWRDRRITTDRTTRLFHDKPFSCGRPVWLDEPIICAHTGPGRVAHRAQVVLARREDGKARRRVLQRLSTIRSCCVRDGLVRCAWWQEVDDYIDFIQTTTFDESLFWPRDGRAILAALCAVVPRPTPPMRRAWDERTARLQAQRDAAEAARRAAWERRQQEEQERQRRAEEERRHQQEEQQAAQQWQADRLRRHQEAVRWAQSKHLPPERLAEVFGLPPTSTETEIRERHCKLALDCHPDRGGDPLMFQLVQNALDYVMGFVTDNE